MRTFQVKNFEKFQHYKDRSPPWIKLYNELLDDYEFGRLRDASKMHLVAIWLLASRSDNKLPYDPDWIAGRINATDKVDLDGLANAGFLVVDQALHTTERPAITPLAERLSRERGRVEVEKKESRASARTETERITDEFQDWYDSYPLHKGRRAAQRAYIGARGRADKDALLNAARSAAKKYAGTDSKFIPHPATWLNQDRWLDDDLQPPKPQEPVSNGKVYVKYGTDQGDAWCAHFRARGKPPPGGSAEGWWFDSEWPPENVSLKQSDPLPTPQQTERAA